MITIKVHATAQRFIFRATADGIQVTCPKNATDSQLRDILVKERAALERLRQRATQPLLLKRDCVLKLTDLTIAITESEFGRSFECRYSKEGRLEIICPPSTNYKRPEVKGYIETAITKVIRHRAEHYLPMRLKELARRVGVVYRECKISHGKQRLGKCDSESVIYLSYRLLLLPLHLSDYVILHELAHLKELNHGDAFHQLLNQYCNGAHRSLELELKNYHFPI